MSGNSNDSIVPPAPAKPDRRVLRTRDMLGDALMQLLREQPFDDITVQQVLDRAGVGRSTFYAHYRDKDDLFLSEVEDFFEAMASLLTRRAAGTQRVAPVRELFAHLLDVRDFYAALVASGKLRDILELAQGIFARSIEQRLLLAGVTCEPLLLKAQSHALAGALFALMSWWIDHPTAATPDVMDATFHRIVWQGFAIP